MQPDSEECAANPVAAMKTRTGTIWHAGAMLLAAVGIAGVMTTAVGAPPSDKGDKVVTGGDLAFMNDAGPGGVAEVELGRLAVERGASAEIKQFAQQMIEDHSKAGEKLKKLAQQKKVTLPPELLPQAKQTKEKLAKLSGSEFDQAYVKAMVEMHVKDVTAFEAVAKTATDADVKAFATETLPTLKHHLQMIRDLAKTMNVSVK
jgi:putative membrane protein